MHDTVEDGHITYEEFQARGLGEPELSALRLVTRDITYQQMIDVIVAADGEAGRIARADQRSDLRHRISRPQPAGRERVVGRRYRPALVKIERAGRPRRVRPGRLVSCAGATGASASQAPAQASSAAILRDIDIRSIDARAARRRYHAL